MTFMQAKEMLDGMKSTGDVLYYEILWDRFIPKSYDVPQVYYLVVWSGNYLKRITGGK